MACRPPGEAQAVHGRKVPNNRDGRLDIRCLTVILTGSGFCAGPLNLNYETPVSTVEDPPQTPARVSQPQVYEERPGHFGQPPSRGPQTAHARLIP